MAGHISPKCLTPPAQQLQGWEKAILRAMITPARGQPLGTLDVKMAQVYYDEIMTDDRIVRFQDISSSEGSEDLPSATVGMRALSMQAVHRPLKKPWDESESESNYTPMSSIVLSSVEGSKAGLAEALHRAPRMGAKVQSCSVSLVPDGELEPVPSDEANKKALRSRIHKVLGAQQEKLEVSALPKDPVWIMVLANDMEPEKKRQRDGRGNGQGRTAQEDQSESSGARRPHKETEARREARRQTETQTQPANVTTASPGLAAGPGVAGDFEGSADKVTKTMRTLNEIWAREGLGPVDWKELAKRIVVPLNLIDFWQVSPEGAKQFRHLSSRKQSNRKAKPKPRVKAKLKT